MENFSNAKQFVKILDEGDNSTVIHVAPAVPYMMYKSNVEAYRKDARRILDKESKELNQIGINSLIAALIIETYGNDNYGKNNK